MGLSTYVVPDLDRLLGHTWKNTAIISFREKKEGLVKERIIGTGW